MTVMYAGSSYQVWYLMPWMGAKNVLKILSLKIEQMVDILWICFGGRYAYGQMCLLISLSKKTKDIVIAKQNV